MRRGIYDDRMERDACGTGFIAEGTGGRGERALPLALRALTRLEHRGAVLADGRTGDGVGVLTAIPRELIREAVPAMGREGSRRFGLGMFFLPRGAESARAARQLIQSRARDEGLELVGLREVPTRPNVLGARARRARPAVVQAFIRRPESLDEAAFERKLQSLHVLVEQSAREAHLVGLHVASLSARTVTYKALGCSEDLGRFYPDLVDPSYRTPFALFHRRFSTNTAPSWAAVQPFRALAHNGEINTIDGNRAWMAARGRALGHLSTDGRSDSATLDEAFTGLLAEGRDPLDAMSLLVPPAWENDDAIDDRIRAFFEWRMAAMEPWDGPAFLVFTDGRTVGACLDRNGLRPARYSVWRDGLVCVASEAGVLDGERDVDVVERGRLGPGDIVAVELSSGRFVDRATIRRELAGRHPYREWLDAGRLPLPLPLAPPSAKRAAAAGAADVDSSLLSAYGVTREELQLVLGPMAAKGINGLGSMGDDTPLAVLSPRPRLLTDYLRQRFAQVTNPPIDSLRESLVMSLRVPLGRRSSSEEPDASSLRIDLTSPVVSPEQLEGLVEGRGDGFRTIVLETTSPRAGGASGLGERLESLAEEASRAVDDGVSLLVLDDREVARSRVPLPALLALSSVHQRLLREGKRTRVSLAVASGEARDDHQIAALVAFGAEAVCPWLVFELLRDSTHLPKGLSDAACTDLEARYRDALEAGLLKIISKMGISTIRSYVGSMLFEAVGLAESLVDRYLPGTVSLVGGLGVADVLDEAIARHDAGFGRLTGRLAAGGFHRFRRNGDAHAYAPEVVKALHAAARSGERMDYEAYARLVRERDPIVLRDLLDFTSPAPVPLDEVEPVEAIVPRFVSAAMSLGALSPEAHEVVAEAMRLIGARSNSGEGGEDRAQNAVKQVASARFGVDTEYLVSAEELQIKMAQGSKPGEGGQLPGHKTVAHIARVRRAPIGTTLISPPPHHDIYSIEDLAELIYDLKRVNPGAPVGVKLVSQAGVGTVAAGVAKAGADAIVIGGHDGGTGASPLSSIKHAGTPWEIGLADAQQALVANGLRSRVRLQVEGGLKTGRDVVIAALLGADELGFGTGVLVAAGCVMARQCHLDTCPAGIATQRADLRARFKGKPEDVASFFRDVALEVREILARLGARRLEDVIGRVDLLETRSDRTGKANLVDLGRVLAEPARGVRRFDTASSRGPSGPSGAGGDEREHPDDRVLERLSRRRPEPLEMRLSIANTDRAVGARIAGAIALRGSGLTPAVRLDFEGSAGQSFGAFAVAGMRLRLEGQANDGLAKGLSGGQVVVKAPDAWARAATAPVLAGNAALYGATGGTLFVAGRAGERFAVRNSGASAVVEGVGDHGCEYMTAGMVVVLGPVGRNFAAGMSGGVAFVLDGGASLEARLNAGMAAVSAPSERDAGALFEILERYRSETGSVVAEDLLRDWPSSRRRFDRVAPIASGRVEASSRDDRAFPASRRKRDPAGNVLPVGVG